MNSNNQGFVKAFSRRNRQAATTNVASQEPDSGVSMSETPVREQTTKQVSAEAAATWWIDEADDNQYRADSDPQQVVPKPHLDDDIQLADENDQMITESFTIGTAESDQLASLYGHSETITMPQPLETSPLETSPDQTLPLETLPLETLPRETLPLETLPSESKQTGLPPTESASPAGSDASISQSNQATRADQAHVRFSIKQLKPRTKKQNFAAEPSDPPSQTDVTVESSQPSPTLIQQPAALTHADAQQAIEDAMASAAATTVFRPAWEVDQFDLPANVAKLFFNGEIFQQIAEQMLEAVDTGLSSVLITSVHGEEGRSTVAMGVAMAAAAAGIRVALVDGDTIAPTLVDDLCLDVEAGWLDAIRDGQPLSSVAVAGLEDGVTFLPLFGTDMADQAKPYEIQQLLKTLKQHFDLVIVDGPIGESDDATSYATSVESAMIVRDVEHTDADEVKRLATRLMQSGIQGVGVIENFA
ncbi:P-loop NTPase [Novipirellula artificiosorum]|uniref:CobQ/CobB/MinD/ParA nucleotide binding domain protein n=1 Tax=Novipirellula artificiosorum TaxID=2528016 RepID=A0A5C6E202_9BACT|nr:P-loop NTPase [Novipirellula artificiosorum]TWU42745.1 CobQ/CobB/MinD/ParA nucleotide binding domain protein [Novipirellula artificiosorum]